MKKKEDLAHKNQTLELTKKDILSMMRDFEGNPRIIKIYLPIGKREDSTDMHEINKSQREVLEISKGEVESMQDDIKKDNLEVISFPFALEEVGRI